MPPDRFLGPPKPQGIIGRLVLDRQLAEDMEDVYIAVRGLSSESLTIAGESSSGEIIGYPVVKDPKTGAVIPGSEIQNGAFVISIDDLDGQWANLAFIKSGSADRLILEIDSLFDYVERIVARPMASPVMPRNGWGLGEWGNMVWGG